MSGDEEPLPPYSFVPGGAFPHPTSSPEGHLFGHVESVAAIDEEHWSESRGYLRGFVLFEAGYYWEAHEAWEALWHAAGRRGPVADVLKGLIKMAASGVKVRQGQRHGIVTHAARAAACFRQARELRGPRFLGLDLDRLVALAQGIVADPPGPRGTAEDRAVRVFTFVLGPTS